MNLRPCAGILIVIIALSTVGHAQSATGRGREVIGFGNWGHPGVVFTVSEDGIGLSEPCFGSGRITGPIELDAQGHFDIEGSYRLNNPIPEAPFHPARFVGQLRGKHLAITVLSLDPSIELIRTYSLRHGGRLGHINCDVEGAGVQ